jgi:hypothetical protein
MHVRCAGAVKRDRFNSPTLSHSPDAPQQGAATGGATLRRSIAVIAAQDLVIELLSLAPGTT